MSHTRRTFLVATGACAASSGPLAASDLSDTMAELVERSRLSNAALMRGDINRYRELVSYTANFTLMSPFGGAPTHGRDLTDAAWERMGRFFRNGSLSQELVEAYGTEDMVVLAIIERSVVEVGEVPAQEWALRVTLVYSREGSEWRLAHRHADPLVAGVRHATAAALARGDLT
jgi:ketosteroid isomerase-like protein